MIIQRMAHFIRQHDWSTAIVEIIVVASVLEKANQVLDKLRAYRDLLRERIPIQANSSAP